MLTSVVVMVAVSLSGLTGVISPGGVSAKPQQYIVDTGNGGGQSLGELKQVCSPTLGGSMLCWIRWGR
jgi:hypothetical protein